MTNTCAKPESYCETNLSPHLTILKQHSEPLLIIISGTVKSKEAELTFIYNNSFLDKSEAGRWAVAEFRGDHVCIKSYVIEN